MVRLGDISPTIWDQVVEYMEFKFANIDFQEEDILFDWRITAKSLRVERELYELYGNMHTKHI